MSWESKWVLSPSNMSFQLKSYWSSEGCFYIEQTTCWSKVDTKDQVVLLEEKVKKRRRLIKRRSLGAKASNDSLISCCSSLARLSWTAELNGWTGRLNWTAGLNGNQRSGEEEEEEGNHHYLCLYDEITSEVMPTLRLSSVSLCCAVVIIHGQHLID